jgi:hypothetical protein
MRFEQRGVPFRDAFDSSFDEVVRLKSLTPRQSRDLLRLRESKITDLQALFCHCLAGGLPRDVLRAARGLARLSSGDESTILATAIQGVIAARVADCVSAAELRLTLDSPEFNDQRHEFVVHVRHVATCWHATVERQRALWEIRDQAADLRSRWPDDRVGDDNFQAARAAALSQARLLDELTATCLRLSSILEAFEPERTGSLLAPLAKFEDPVIQTGYGALADAKTTLAIDPLLSWMMIIDARRVLGLPPPPRARKARSTPTRHGDGASQQPVPSSNPRR